MQHLDPNHSSILDSLTPRERHTYFELVRLAAPADWLDEELEITIPKGSLILSFDHLEKQLDVPRSTIRRAISRLEEKGLVELVQLGKSFEKNNTQALCMLKQYDAESSHLLGHRPSLSAGEMVYQLETQHLRHRYLELETYYKRKQQFFSPRDAYLFQLLLHTYEVAQTIAASDDHYLSTQQGLFLEDNDLKVLVHGESTMPGKIDLQVKAILQLLETLDLSAIEGSEIAAVDIAEAIRQRIQHLLTQPTLTE